MMTSGLRFEIEEQMRAVIKVLSEAVSRGEIDDILAQLPPEFDRFFREAVEGPL